MSTNTLHDGTMEEMTTGPCPDCGFQPDRVPPSDIAVALRSFPRRFRGVLIAVDDTDAERLTAAPAPGEWSALQHAGHVRDVLHAIDMRLQRVLREDGPRIGDTPATPPAAVAGDNIDTTLATLQANAEQLARTVESVAGREWTRAGQRDGAEITALDLAREAVHEGAHHLREAQEVITELRQRG